MTSSSPLPDNIDELKKTPAYETGMKRNTQQAWRIDNLYTIVDENGREVKFQRNPAQLLYMRNRWPRDCIVKARQMGFSTLIELLILDTCMFRDNITAGIVDATLDDAETKLAKVKFAYDRMAPGYQKANPLRKANTQELVWENGSNVSASTSYRGGTPQILHVSEYGRISVDSPDRAREIKKGSLQGVHATGWVACESTAHGTAGEFYDMTQSAKRLSEEGRKLTALDYRLHFYGWWLKAEYRIQNNLVVVSQEVREYFAEIAPKLKARYGFALDADQQAWYAKKLEELGWDDMFEEFPTIIEETFFNSIRGAFWKREISAARRDQRIGLPMSYDSTRPVHTGWDIGEDGTAVLFFQHDGLRFRFIDYWEEEGGSLQSAAGMLDQKKQERGWIYGKHIGPHDLDHKDWAHQAQTRKTTAAGLGIAFEVVPQVRVKADSIEAGRRLFNMSWFDEVRCNLLVERLENYRKRWNKALQVYSAEPVHDASSHPADGFQQIAMFHSKDFDMKPDRDRSRPKAEPRRTSQWAS